MPMGEGIGCSMGAWWALYKSQTRLWDSPKLLTPCKCILTAWDNVPNKVVNAKGQLKQVQQCLVLC